MVLRLHRCGVLAHGRGAVEKRDGKFEQSPQFPRGGPCSVTCRFLFAMSAHRHHDSRITFIGPHLNALWRWDTMLESGSKMAPGLNTLFTRAFAGCCISSSELRSPGEYRSGFTVAG